MPARFRLRGDRLLFLALAALIVFLWGLYVLLEKAEEFSPRYFTNTVLLTVLGFANALLILALIYVLFRNLILLVAERRRGTLGSQFQTKLVVIFLGLTLIPSILLFVAAGQLIQHSIKKWFAPPVDEMVSASQEVLEATYERYREDAMHFADEIAGDVADRRLLSPSQRRRLRPALEERLREYGVDLIVVSAGGEAPMTVVRPRLSLTVVNALPWDLVARAQDGRTAERIDDLATGRMVRASVSVPGTGGSREPPPVVTVGYLIPERIAGLTRQMTRAADDYRQSKALENPIQRSYYLVLILVAVLVVFATVWVGMALARRITVPIQRLAEGTREVAAGNLDFRLEVDADDEIGILVDSFNRMTRDLQAAKDGEERSHRELETTNRELADRRRYMETLLENITPGVISLDRDGRVSTINRSACRILEIDSADAARGLTVEELLARGEHRDLLERVRTAQVSGAESGEQQLHIHSAGRPLTLTATFTPLREPTGETIGVIVVLEDVTQVIRAEKVAAWQEVARRLAHEIKNPLTPIQLSAQRIAKKCQEQSPDLTTAVEEGTQAIVNEVRGVKKLLDEFSRFARLPAVRPVPSNIHQVIDQAIALYDGLHPDLTFRREYGANGGPITLDPEQMKRVCVNLFDNAIQAMDGRGTITVSTRSTSDGAGLRIAITDEGPGIPPEDRERMFLPYFSTKRRGTGLGLAIVNRIVSDHDGTVRYEQKDPQGGRFVIDLPVRA
jgi:two-component system nitrogen regulation sensor histidine kinase NtrY